jgi:uncharacterized protein
MTKLPPYRTLSSFLRERFGERVQKITLDASLGCPHRGQDGSGGCIYCNAKGSGTGSLALGISLGGQIEAQMAAMARRYKARSFIAYFQSYSNTYADISTLRELYDSILPYPEIIGLAIGTRPDCVDIDKLSLINTYAKDHLVWIEYGLQSASDVTLKRINRGHDVKTFSDAVNLASTFDMRICAHLIIGLPGEGVEEYVATANLISELPVTDIKIHLLYVVRGTILESIYNQGEYTPLDMDTYAKAVAACIAHLRDDIVIQRITGDPHADELVAPSWALDKHRIRSAIHGEMARSGLHQGSLRSGR